jgi:multidrug efflux pump subunit AcrA (membrane-fusion protein)
LLGLLLALLAMQFVSCGVDGATVPPAQDSMATRVHVETVGPPTSPAKVRRTTTILSRKDIQLSLESMGVIAERPLAEGSRVKVGELLFQLDARTELDQLRAAESQLELWTGEVSDLSSRRRAESAVSLARTAWERRFVRSPINGTIQTYYLDKGEFASPGVPLARLVDLKNLYVKVLLLQEEVARLLPDAQVDLSLAQFGERRFGARVTRIADAAIPGQSRFEVELDLAPSEDLKPGFLATAHVPLTTSEEVLILPRDAIFLRHGTERVFVVKSVNQELIANEQQVETREHPGRPELAEVLKGLAKGDRVITRGRLGLSDQSKIALEGP